jgi:thiol-disulfide isomerase/thioredoxin
VPPLPTFPPANAAPTPTPTVTPTSHGGSTLAGTVIDAYYRPVPNAYIRWVNIEEKDSGAPIDVAANANGHFIIQGLKPGTAYKLIARTKKGEKMFAGVALTTAPNVRVAIMVRDDLITGDIPPLPTAPAAPPAQGVGKTDRAVPDPFLGPGAPGVEPNLPAEIAVPSAPKNTSVGNPPAAAEDQGFVPGIVDVPKDRMPMLKIPHRPPNPEAPRPPLVPGQSKLDTGPARVPSCVLVGNHLENLALKDSKGQTWEYKKHGAGKLVLIDFWGTYCLHCRESMPILNRLHQQYGSRGLEVLGVALEAGENDRKEADAVNKFAGAMQLNYRQLMGRSSGFDVGKNFKVTAVPTLILLNEQGDIFIHHMGKADPAFWSMLERTIQNRLSVRPL